MRVEMVAAQKLLRLRKTQVDGDSDSWHWELLRRWQHLDPVLRHAIRHACPDQSGELGLGSIDTGQ